MCQGSSVGERTAFPNNSAETVGIHMQKIYKNKKYIDNNFLPYTKINSEWITDNVEV